MKKSTKVPRVGDHTDLLSRVDTDKKYKNREQKLPSPIHTNPPPSATRGKYTKKLMELVKQRLRGHYILNKYDLPRATHRYSTRAQVKIVDPMAQHVAVLATDLQGHHQENFSIDPTTGASL